MVRLWWERAVAVLASVVMAMALVPVPAHALVAADGVQLSAQAALRVSNPRVVAGSSMTAGQKATWDCVWFGSYPQDVVSDASTVSALDAASWSGNRATVDGVTYQRLYKTDTTNSGFFDGFDSSCYGGGSCLYFRCSPVKWRVLETDGATALLLADQALDCRRYHGSYTSVTWETCDLRSWLNSEFTSCAFIPAEKSAIQRQALANEDNPEFGTEGGNATQDDVFLLALSDVYGDGAPGHGFSSDYSTYDEARCAHVSDFARAMGGSRSTYHGCQPDSGWWWLRSPGDYAHYASYVYPYGYVARYGSYVDCNAIVVRPALRISLSTNQISYAGTVCSDGTDAEVGGGDVPAPAPAPVPAPAAPKTAVGPSSGAAKSLKLDNNVNITVPEGVPLVDKRQISLDFDDIGVEFEREGNTFKIGIGVKNLQDMSEQDWGTFKRFVEKQDESLRKGIDSLLAAKFGTATMGMGVKPKVSCYGYAEGTITSAGVQSVEGKISIEVKAKASQEWQTAVWVIPVVFTFEGSVGAKASYALGFDFDAAKVYTDGTFALTLPKIKLTAGVGIAYIADISVYGSANNKVSFTRRAAGKSIEATLSGELGVRARALFFEYERALLKGDWKYYSSSDSALGTQSAQPTEPEGAGSWFGIERAQAGAWRNDAEASGFSAQSDAGASAANVATLQTDVFGGAQPALVRTASGVRVLVFAKDEVSRGTGNHTTIAYSVQDGATSEWREPVIIDDDGTADFDPSVAVDGDNVWVAWGNAKRVFSADEAAADDFVSVVAASCEVECAKIDLSGAGADVDAGVVTTFALTDDDDFDLKPQMAMAAGAPCVAWVSNAGNDALALSGGNTVMRATLAAGADSFAAEAVRTTDLPVASLAAGQLAGGLALAFAEDSDGDLTTTQDMRLYAAGQAGGAVVQAEGGFAPRLAKLGGGDVLCWLQSGDEGVRLCSAAQVGGAVETVIPADVSLSSDYTVVPAASAGAADLVLCPVAKGGEADGSEPDGRDIASWMLSDGSAAGPIALTQADGYASAPCGIFANGALELAFLRSDVTVADGRVKQSSDLCVASALAQPSAQVVGVEFDEAAMVPSAMTHILATVRNDGLGDAESGSVSISMGDAVLADAELGTLASGESTVVDVEVTLPDDMVAGSAMRVSATLGSATDVDEVTVGKANLVLSAEERDGGVEITVANDSGFATGATLKVLAADGVTELGSFGLGDVAEGAAVTKVFSRDEVAAFDEDSLVFDVDASGEELYESDNLQVLYVGGSILATPDHLEVAVPTDSYRIGHALDPTAATVQVVYADGSVKTIGADAYTTNVFDIDMWTRGAKTLTYAYEEVGVIRTVDVPITVSAGDISAAYVELASASVVYDGSPKQPEVTVTYRNRPLVRGADYTLAYSDNVDVGTATVTVTGIGDYEGEKVIAFDIAAATQPSGGDSEGGDDSSGGDSSGSGGSDSSGSGESGSEDGSGDPAPAKKSLSSAKVVLSQSSCTYDGKAKKPAVTVMLGGARLAIGTDFTVAYGTNVGAGTAKVTVKGAGGYEGTVSATFKIAKAANPMKVTSKARVATHARLKRGTIYAYLLSVKGAVGKVTFAKASGSKKLSVNKADGRIAIKKGAKRGAHKMIVKVRAAGNANYKAASKRLKVVVKVR